MPDTTAVTMATIAAVVMNCCHPMPKPMSVLRLPSMEPFGSAPRVAGRNEPYERLLRRIENSWIELRDSYAGLSDAQLTEPGVAGTWSIKDVLAHVTTWEEEALKHLPTVIQGKRPPRYAQLGGIDAFNARMAERKRSMPLGSVLAQLDETHHRLIELVRNAPEDQLSSQSRFIRRLRLDSFGHYRIHSQAIRAWRKERAVD